MVTPVTGIVADLQLQSAGFIRDLEKASRAVAKNTSAMQRSMRSVETGINTAVKAMGAFLGLAAGRQLLAFTNEMINNAAAIKEQAKAVGIGTDELQAFRVAGERAGVAVSTMDKSLGIFVKNIGQARIGAGPLVSALKNTNKELLESLRNATSAGEGLEILFQAIKSAPNEFERARIAQAAFSKGWREMVLLAQEDTPEARKRFQELGLTIRNDVIEQADELQDTMRDLQRSFQNGFTTGFIDGFNNSLKTTEERLVGVNDIGKLFGDQTGKSLQDMASVFEKIASIANGGSIKEAVEDFFSLGKVSIREGSVLDWIRDIVGPLWDKFSKIMNFVPSQTIDTGPVGVIPEAPAANPHGLETVINPEDTNVVKDYTLAINDNAKALEGWEATTVDALGRSMEFEDLQSEGIDIFKDSQTAIEEYGSSIERLKTLYNSGAIDAQTFGRAHQQLTLGMAENWLGAAGAVTGALSSMFKENKAFAIADAVVNTAAAIVAALKNPPGPPFSFVYAAAAAAAGAAQIATILSAQPGKSKTPSVSGSGKSVKAPKAAGDSSTSSNSGGDILRQTVTINIEGDSFGPDHFKKLAKGLNGVIRDGAVVKVA